jgi:hypothetical protein
MIGFGSQRAAVITERSRVGDLASRRWDVFRRLPSLAWAGLAFLLVFGWLFRPVLAGEASIVHGDAVSVSLSLQSLLSAALAQGVFPLWSDQIYGGHPIFAEAQGGFAHPLNWVLFGLLDPVYAHGLFHFSCGLIGGLGCFALCRSLGLGFGASMFGGLALVCSQGWLALTANATIAGAVAWGPLALLALERWWIRPDVPRAVILALPVASMLLAGYPQAAHGIVLYMALYVAARCLNAELVRRPSRLWPHVKTGAVAAAIALGLAAVQLLPLLELVRESIRAEGISAVTSPPPSWFYRGLLFTAWQREAMSIPGLGSMLVTSLAVAALVSRPRAALLGHLLATAFLLQLAMGEHSALYRLLQHRLPGLDSFRTTQLYLTIALTGVSVLAAAGVDGVAKLKRLDPLRGALLVGAVLAVTLAGAVLHNDFTPRASFAFALVAWVGLALLFWLGRTRAAPALLLLVLLAEIQWLRAPLLGFASSELLRTPPVTVGYLQRQEDRDRDFRIANVPHLHSYLGFAPGNAANLEWLLRLHLASVEAAGNLIWDLSSMHANLALPLARRQAAEDLLVSEVQGQSARPRGRRLIDLMGVRFVLVHHSHRKGADKREYSPDLEEVFYDEQTRYYILENPHSLPRLQFYSRAAWARDVHDAVSMMQEADAPALILEELSGAEEGSRRAREPAGTTSVSGAQLRVTTSSPERYELELEVSEPGFLFLADANYPGWEAHVDGEPAPVYYANALGKAVPVSAGFHHVEVVFRSKPFRRGLWLSLATSALVLLALARSAAGRETGPAA